VGHPPLTTRLAHALRHSLYIFLQKAAQASHCLHQSNDIRVSCVFFIKFLMTTIIRNRKVCDERHLLMTFLLFLLSLKARLHRD